MQTTKLLKVALFLPFPDRKDSRRTIEKMEALGVEVIPYPVPCTASKEKIEKEGAQVLAYVFGTTIKSQLVAMELLAKKCRLPFLCLGRGIHEQEEALRAHIAAQNKRPVTKEVFELVEVKKEPPRVQTEEAPPSTGIEFVAVQSVVPLCAVVVCLLDQGYTWVQAAPHVQRFWKGGEELTADRLRGYVHRLAGLPERCPPFFRVWWEEYQKREHAPHRPPGARFDPDAPEGALPAREPSDIEKLYEEAETLNGQLAQKVRDLEQTVRAREQEVQHLVNAHQREEAASAAALAAAKKSIQVLEATVKEADQWNTTLEANLAKARAAMLQEEPAAALAPGIQAKHILAIRTLVESGFLKHEEVLDRLLHTLEGAPR